jgi:hypothetical protein
MMMATNNEIVRKMFGIGTQNGVYWANVTVKDINKMLDEARADERAKITSEACNILGNAVIETAKQSFDKTTKKIIAKEIFVDYQKLKHKYLGERER